MAAEPNFVIAVGSGDSPIIELHDRPADTPDRLTFNIDPVNRECLRNLTENGEFRSMAEAVRFAIQLADVIVEEAKKGHSQIELRTAKGKKPRVISAEVFDRMSKPQRRKKHS